MELQEIESAYVKKLNRIKKLKRDRLIKIRHLGIAESKCESVARKSRVSHANQHGGSSRATSAATSEATAIMNRTLTPFTPPSTRGGGGRSSHQSSRVSTASSASTLAGLHPALLAAHG